MGWRSHVSGLACVLGLIALFSGPVADLDARQGNATPMPSATVVIGDVIAAAGAPKTEGEPWMFRVNPARTGEDPGPGPKTPAVRWSFAAGGAISSSPALDGDQVFVGSANGALYAIDVAAGTARWQFATQGEIFSS